MSTLFVFQAQASDPLFIHMEGHWQGHGLRTYPLSGKQVTVDADVQTSAQEVNGKSGLLSQNHITESNSATTPPTVKTYLSVYWVLPVDGQPGSYELGAQGSTQPSSSGVLGADGVFRVEQDLGSGYVVKSQTVFESSGPNGDSTYSDVFSSGTEIQSQTQIEYKRIAP